MVLHDGRKTISFKDLTSCIPRHAEKVWMCCLWIQYIDDIHIKYMSIYSSSIGQLKALQKKRCDTREGIEHTHSYAL